MKVCIVIALAALVTAAFAKPAYPAYEYAPSPYSFAYVVKDDPSYNDFGHSETSDGKIVTGSYSVVLTDGRKQTVTYKVDAYSGYVAEVKYEGVAKYPEYKAYAAPAAYKPTYSAPAPIVEYKTSPPVEYQAPPAYSVPASKYFSNPY